MNVIIPLAGRGTRLRPHTHTKPKPLVNVAGKTVLGHILDSLKGLPIDEMVFIVGYLGDQIADYVEANYKFPSHFVEQKELKGQAHAIRLAREYVSGPVLIIFVDTIFEIDLPELENVKSDGLIYVKEVEDPKRFGVVTLQQNYISRFVEKPDEPVSNLAVIGVYYIKDSYQLFRSIEELLARDQKTKGEFFLADALQIMVDRGAKLEARTVDVWEDCGTTDAILRTNRFLLRKLHQTEEAPPGCIVRPPVFIDPTAQVEHSVIGPYVTIGPNCVINSSVIGPYVSVAEDAEIRNSLVKDSILNENAEIVDSTLTSSLIGSGARVIGTYERLNVGDMSEVDQSYRVLPEQS
ncbi:MAG: nucleotidyltransferase [Chloroflexi bacterium]|nr:nucleotidyltransferase [Chloroflexota bacterium]